MTSAINVTKLCEPKKNLVIFPQKYLFRTAKDVCSTHGGTMFTPTSNLENDRVLEILSKHEKACSNKFLRETKNGWGLWLGVNKIGSAWFQSNDNKTLTYHNWIKGKSNFQSTELDCAFMIGDGSWSSFRKQDCSWIQLCVVCSISANSVFTMNGLCKQGTFLHWNYYLSLDDSEQIDEYESYKRGLSILHTKKTWGKQKLNDSISLQLQGTKQYPVGKNEWMWRITGCSTAEVPIKRNLTFSVCDIGREFTCDFGNCIKIEYRCDGTENCNDGSDEIECVFIVKPVGYQKLDPPTNGRDGNEDHADVVVNVDIVVEHIHLIDTSNMMLGATLRVKMGWKDNRLTFKHLRQHQKQEAYPYLLNDIWSPLDHLVFDNAALGHKHLEKETKFLILPKSAPLPFDVFLNREENMFDGQTTEMEIIQRLKNTFTCPFQFTCYPFEMHTCHLNMTIESPEDRILKIIVGNITYEGSRSVKQFEIAAKYNKLSANVMVTSTQVPKYFSLLI